MRSGERVAQLPDHAKAPGQFNTTPHPHTGQGQATEKLPMSLPRFGQAQTTKNNIHITIDAITPPGDDGKTTEEQPGEGTTSRQSHALFLSPNETVDDVLQRTLDLDEEVTPTRL
jgi:hypothetical protein